MYSKYLWGVLLFALLVQGGRVNERQAAAAGDEDDARSLQQTADEDQPQQFKPVLVARRPLLQQRPSSVQVETERQPVIVVRQSPRLLQQRQRGGQPAEDEDEQAVRQQAGRQQQQLVQQRAKEQPQKEPVQTIRNYNKLNDDGSFTFGYESADGSFKEETRGTDCVVRGKYGYVDPDGNKREFSYVQGNPCDPNAVEDEEDQPLKPGEAENVPDAPNVPINAPKPKPKKTRPTTTLFQQTFGDFEAPQQQQPQPSSTPRQPGRLQQQPLQDISRRPSAAAPPPQFRPSAAQDDLDLAIQNLPRPSGGKSQQLQVPAGPNAPVFTTELVFDPATGQFNTVILQQVAKQQQAAIDTRQRLPAAPAPKLSQPKIQPPPQFQPQPIQFQPQPAFQPQTAFQPQPAFQPQFGTQSTQFRTALQPFQFQPQRSAEFDFQKPEANGPQQQRIQQQQALTIQQSQNLFRQQQKQQQQPFQSQFFPPRLEPQTDAQQQFVFVQPGRTPGQQNLAVGQIDAFLRGHNVQF